MLRNFKKKDLIWSNKDVIYETWNHKIIYKGETLHKGTKEYRAMMKKILIKIATS